MRIYSKYKELFESEDLRFWIYKRFPAMITRFIVCC